MARFEDVDLFDLAVPPEALERGKLVEVECQTRPVYVEDASSQVRELVVAETQTGQQTEGGGSVPKRREDDPATLDRLARALDRMVPGLEELLESTLHSKAFDGVMALNGAGNEGQSVPHKFTLPPPAAVRSAGLECTGVSWNANGTVIVGVYGRKDISGWCTLPGAVAAWPIFRRDFDPSASPEWLFEHSSCIMCVACHPLQPSIVAAGSFNGEVLLVDLSSADTPVTCSRIDDYFHREPVRSLRWLYDIELHAYHLVSVSGEGKVLFWALKGQLEFPFRGVRLDLRKTGIAGARGVGGGPEAVHGGTAIAFVGSASGGDSANRAAMQSSSMVVGTESGNLLAFPPPSRDPGSGPGWHWDAGSRRVLGYVNLRDRRSVQLHVETWARKNGRRHIDASAVFLSKPNPDALFGNDGESRGQANYEPHVGPVAAIDGSPFHRQLFASIGTDGLLRLFTLMQGRPLVEIEAASGPLSAVTWSSSRPMVLAVTCENGKVLLYDLKVSSSLPVVELQPPYADAESPPSALSVCFNQKMRSFIGTGDAAGNVHIFTMPWGLANSGETEKQDLAQFVENWAEAED